VLDKAAFYYLGIFISLVAAGLGFPIPEEFPIVTAGALVGHGSAGTMDHDTAAKIIPALGASLTASPDSGVPAGLPWAGLPVRADDRFVYLTSDLTGPIDLPLSLRWWIMLPLCILGVVISDGMLYGVGRFWGPRLLNSRWMKRLVPPEKRQRIEDNFHNYGVLVLLFARFLPTIRSPVFITAGIMRLSFARFLVADGLYAIPGVSLLFFLAFWFGDQFRDLIYAAEGKVQAARPILILIGLAAITAYLIYHFFRHPVATGDPREEIPVIGGQVTKIIGHADQVLESSAAGPTGSGEFNPDHQPSSPEQGKLQSRPLDSGKTDTR
jgi:membrane protein DedA with SNARE-associated domain